MAQSERDRASVAPASAGRLDDVRWIEFPSHGDSRGVLTAIEGGIDIPFEIRRLYFVHDVITERGGHAHRDTHQVVTAVSGRCELRLSDGKEERLWVLDRPTRGVLINPMLFIRMVDFAPGTVVAAFASTHYDTKRSIRSWDEYLAAIRA